MPRNGPMAFLATLGIGLAGAALAHSGATGIVKQRMDTMSDIAANTKTIGDMLKGTKPFDAVQVRTAAQSIAAHASMAPDLFPEGSNASPSEALPLIWEDWDGFIVGLRDMEESANALAERAGTASGVADIRETFAKLGKSCQSCHSRYRLKK